MAPPPRTGWSAGWIDPLCWALLVFNGWFAVHFASERILVDAAYFLVRMVDDAGFFVSHGRWIMPLSQGLAVLAIKLALPLRAVIALYSLGGVVVAGMAYFFVRYVLQDHRAGLAVVATQLIGVGHAAFCPVFEFYYAAPLLLACLALLRSTRLAPPLQGVWFSALLFLVFSSHFLAMLVAGMALLLAGVHRQPHLRWLALAMLVLHLIIRSAVLSDYERRAITSLWIRFEGLGWTWVFRPGRLLGHLEHMLSVYPDVVFLYVLLMAALVQVRAWRTLAAFLGGVLVLYVLQSFYFPDGTHSVYREFVDHPFAVWAVVVPYILGARPVPGLGPWYKALGLFLVLRCMLWLDLSGTYADRVAWIRSRIDAAHEQGIGLGLVKDVPTFITPRWGSVKLPGLEPMETVLLSATDGTSSTVLLLPWSDTTATAAEMDTTLEARMRAERIPLPWDTPSPYFDLPRTPLRVVR